MEGINFDEVCIISAPKDEVVNCSVYDLNTTKLMCRYEGGISARNSLALINDDYLISALKNEPAIKVWTLSKTQREECTMPVPGFISNLLVTECGNYVVAAIDSSIYIWEVASGSLMRNWIAHPRGITCLRLSRDSTHIFSGGKDGLVHVWYLVEAVSGAESGRDLKPHITWDEHSAEVTDIFAGILGSNALVVTTSLDMTCIIYDFPNKMLLAVVRVDFGMTAVTMDNSESIVIVGSCHGNLYRIDLGIWSDAEKTAYNKEWIYKGHVDKITALSISASGKILLSGSADEYCRIWNINTYECLRAIEFVGCVTNAFITLKPHGLKVKREFDPKVYLEKFKMSYDEEDSKFGCFTAKIKDTDLCLFHHGAPDEIFDPQVLTMSEERVKALSKSTKSIKQASTINAQLYSFALSDTKLDIAAKKKYPKMVSKKVVESDPRMNQFQSSGRSKEDWAERKRRRRRRMSEEEDDD